MGKFIQYRTNDSLYDGPFGKEHGWPAAGLCDIVITDNGRLIVIDGGQPNDAEDLIKLLEEKAYGKKPIVDLWIITHPHLDHYGALQAICRSEKLASRISVKKLLWYFPTDFCNKAGDANILGYGNNDMEEICRITGAAIYKPSRNDIINIDDIEIHFLYVPDDCSFINTASGNANCVSLIFTVKGNSKSVMVTGDAHGRNMQITVWRYAKKLKCDILQLPHHACCDSYCSEFYYCVDPQIVLEPTSAACFKAMHTEYFDFEGAKANRDVEEKAEMIYKAFEGTVELEI